MNPTSVWAVCLDFLPEHGMGGWRVRIDSAELFCAGCGGGAQLSQRGEPGPSSLAQHPLSPWSAAT